MAEPADEEKPVVYVETSVISYLAARRSRHVILAGQQAATKLWWRGRKRFRLVTSDIAIREASLGDPAAAERRLLLLREIDLPPFPKQEVERLAASLLDPGPLPRKAGDVAAHAAVAVILRADYLCSWNFKHLVNPTIREGVERICRDHGYEPAIICTPYDLLTAGPPAAEEE